MVDSRRYLRQFYSPVCYLINATLFFFLVRVVLNIGLRVRRRDLIAVSNVSAQDIKVNSSRRISTLVMQRLNKKKDQINK